MTYKANFHIIMSDFGLSKSVLKLSVMTMVGAQEQHSYVCDSDTAILCNSYGNRTIEILTLHGWCTVGTQSGRSPALFFFIQGNSNASVYSLLTTSLLCSVSWCTIVREICPEFSTPEAVVFSWVSGHGVAYATTKDTGTVVWLGFGQRHSHISSSGCFVCLDP